MNFPTPGKKYVLEVRPVRELRRHSKRESLFDGLIEWADKDALAKSIDAYGLRQPVVIRCDGLVLDGWRRVEAVESLGYEFVEVLVLQGELSDDQAFEFWLATLATNRTIRLRDRHRLYAVSKHELLRLHGQPIEGDVAGAGNTSWQMNEIGRHAAAIAGLESAEKGEMLLRVFRDGNRYLRSDIEEGNLSIERAYQQLREQAAARRKQRSAKSSQPTESDLGASPASTNEDGQQDDDEALDDRWSAVSPMPILEMDRTRAARLAGWTRAQSDSQKR